MSQKHKKEKTKKTLTNVYDTVAEVYNDFLIYFDKQNELPDAKRNKMDQKFDPFNLFLEGYGCFVGPEKKEESSHNKESKDIEESVDLSDMPPL